MNVLTRQALADMLEKIVDEHGLPEIVEALAMVASAKADHIESNWQDCDLAKRWNTVAAGLLKAERTVRINIGYDPD